MAKVSAPHGGVDVLINNAGIAGSQKAVLEEDLESWERVIGVNQTGVFLGMRAVLPAMRAKKRGSIVNVSSIWGIGAVAVAAAYQASKAAVCHITKHAAIAYGPDNVRVNSVHPGIVDTPLVQGQPKEANAYVVARTPLGRMAHPSEIAQALLFLASEESSFITGAELFVDGGYLAH
jgi:3alpha(or 20beta)-hydroxysteroid dehydrogenase